MATPITRLYVHAPLAPRPGREELGEPALESQFAWYCNGPQARQGVGSIGQMPYADEAYVFIPTIDVRFITLVVPAVNRKKLQTILPTLLEEHLLSTEPIQPIVFAPRVGQAANQRIVAVMERSWYDWLTHQLKELLAARVVVLADCFVLPAPEGSQPAPAFSFALAGSMLAMQVRRTGLQTGVAFLEQGPSTAMPQPWDWSWVVCASFDEAVLQTNLIEHRPHRTSSTLRVQGSWPAFMRQMLLRLNTTLGIGLLAFVVYGLCIYGLDWKWRADLQGIASSAAQALPPNTPGSNDRSENAITAVIQAANRNVHRQGQLSGSDFVTLASQLQQLRAQLPADAVTQIDYQDGNLLVQMRPGIDTAVVIAKAKELGMALVLLGPQRFQLLANAGLEAMASRSERGTR